MRPHDPEVGSERDEQNLDLTPVELRVVDLASEGLTNAEIGQRLHLSRRTVQGHLYRIFKKAGVATRTQLAALWFRAQQAAATSPEAVASHIPQGAQRRGGSSHLAQGGETADGELAPGREKPAVSRRNERKDGSWPP